ncbi:hypothetical protein JCM6882_006102 [Rhodosporidiobolus microsporus]
MPSIDSLPNELLIDILSLVDPPPPFRRRPSHALYRCCLVSKRWRECAQPLLWQSLVLSRRVNLGTLPKSERISTLLRQVRLLTIDEWRPPTDQDPLELRKVLMAAEELCLIRTTNFPFFSVLRRLYLQDLNIHSCDVACTLPNLTALVIDGCAMPTSYGRTFFTHKTLPALRTLSIGRISFDVSSETPDKAREVLRFDFVSRLETVQLPVSRTTGALLEQWALDKPPSTTSPSNVLVVASAADVRKAWDLRLHHHISHLVLAPSPRPPSESPTLMQYLDLRDRPYYVWEVDDREYNFRQLVFSCHNLVTVFLPLELRDASPPSSKVALHRDAVLEACEERRVEVLWADGPFDEEADGRGSALPREEFARWVRGKRAEEEGRGQEA